MAGSDQADKANAIKVAKALAHPLRVSILGILETPVIDPEKPDAPAKVRLGSPNELAKELGEPLGNISYHMKTLLEYDCVELVKTVPRRGAVEHYYRSTERTALPSANRLNKSQRTVLLKLVEDYPAGIPDLTEEEQETLASARPLLAA